MNPDPNIEAIKRQVADHYGVAPWLLSAKTRRDEIVKVRHVGMYLSKKLTSEHLKAIAIGFGRTNHATVIHACKSVENRLDTDPAFRKHFARLETRLHEPQGFTARFLQSLDTVEEVT